MNQVVIVGRLVEEPTMFTIGEKKVGKMKLAVSRNYKNAEGIYETDFIDFEIWQGIFENTKTYCKVGDVIGVRGRIENDFKMDGQRIIKLIAEKITFLSSTKNIKGEK